MNYAILRIRKLKPRAAEAMAHHALRSKPTPNADPTRIALNRVTGPKDAATVMNIIKSRTDPLVKRKDNVRVVEVLVGASPELMLKMQPHEQDAYFERALYWLIDKFGSDIGNVVLSVIHRDESTPHMQVLLTPIVNGVLAANKVIGGPRGLSRLQSDFHEKVGAAFNLRRGEKGSRSKHVSMRQLYAANEAALQMGALPEKKAIKPLPPKPAPGSSREDIEDYNKAVRLREVAIEHNERAEKWILQLARLGAAVLPFRRRLIAAEPSAPWGGRDQVPPPPPSPTRLNDVVPSNEPARAGQAIMKATPDSRAVPAPPAGSAIREAHEIPAKASDTEETVATRPRLRLRM